MSGKRAYPSQDVAEEALLEAHMRNEFKPGQGPITVYLCQDCGNFHLTSQGTMNSRLKKALDEGEIRKGQVARRWTEKWKRK